MSNNEDIGSVTRGLARERNKVNIAILPRQQYPRISSECSCHITLMEKEGGDWWCPGCGMTATARERIKQPWLSVR
jgi:hypothetical protein